MELIFLTALCFAPELVGLAVIMALLAVIGAIWQSTQETPSQCQKRESHEAKQELARLKAQEYRLKIRYMDDLLAAKAARENNKAVLDDLKVSKERKDQGLDAPQFNPLNY